MANTYKIKCTVCGEEIEVKGVFDPTQDQFSFICESCMSKRNADSGADAKEANAVITDFARARGISAEEARVQLKDNSIVSKGLDIESEEE